MRFDRRARLVLLCVAAACRHEAEAPKPKTAQQETVFLLAVHASPDSALKLARYCLGAIEGTIQLPQVRPTHTTISTHYSRNRAGGGVRQVSIMVLVRHDKGASPNTFLEVGGWALDLAQAQAPRTRPGVPATALSSNAPALKTPRGVTPRDTVDWYSVEVVLAALEGAGARRVP